MLDETSTSGLSAAIDRREGRGLAIRRGPRDRCRTRTRGRRPAGRSRRGASGRREVDHRPCIRASLRSALVFLARSAHACFTMASRNRHRGRTPPCRGPSPRSPSLILAFPAIAAPREKGPSPEALAAGDQFARQLGVVAQMVSREYLRPVADRRPVRRGRRRGSTTRPAGRGRPSFCATCKTAKTETERVDLVKRARAEVHGAAGAGRRPRPRGSPSRRSRRVLDPHSVLLPNAAVNGTTTSTAYGFEFDGEAQAVRPRTPIARSGISTPRPNRADRRPPLPFRVLTVKPGSPGTKGRPAARRHRPRDRRRRGRFADGGQGVRKACTGPGRTRTNPGLHHLVVDRVGERYTLGSTWSGNEFVPGIALRRHPQAGQHVGLLARPRRGGSPTCGLGRSRTTPASNSRSCSTNWSDVRGLVFDLRWCPGGYIDAGDADRQHVSGDRAWWPG